MNEYPWRNSDRQSFYGAGKAGRLYSICDQTAPPAAYLGQTSFVATTPTFMLYKSAGTTFHALRNIELSQRTTVAAAAIDIHMALASVSRYSSGGTAIVPKNYSTDKFAIPKAITDLTVTANATATAAAATTYWFKSYTAVAQLGSTIKLECLDGVILGPTSSLLIYCIAAGTAPTLALNGDVIEEISSGSASGT